MYLHSQIRRVMKNIGKFLAFCLRILEMFVNLQPKTKKRKHYARIE